MFKQNSRCSSIDAFSHAQQKLCPTDVAVPTRSMAGIPVGPGEFERKRMVSNSPRRWRTPPRSGPHIAQPERLKGPKQSGTMGTSSTHSPNQESTLHSKLTELGQVQKHGLATPSKGLCLCNKGVYLEPPKYPRKWDMGPMKNRYTAG